MRQRQPHRPREAVIVPKNYAGQWIVWNRQRTKIIGDGKSLKEAQAAARASGEDEPGYEWIPPANRRLVGSRQ